MCRSELTFRCTSHLRPAEQSVLVSQDAPWTSHPLAAPRGKARTCACDDKHGVPASRKLGSRGWLFAVRFNMAMHQVGCKRAFLKAPVFAKSPPRLLQYEQFARLPSVYHCCVADTAGSTEFHKHKWTCPVFPPGKIVHSAFQATGSSFLPGQPRLTNIGLSRAIRYHIFSEEPADPYWKQVRYTPVTPASSATCCPDDTSSGSRSSVSSGSSRCGVSSTAQASDQEAPRPYKSFGMVWLGIYIGDSLRPHEHVCGFVVSPHSHPTRTPILRKSHMSAWTEWAPAKRSHMIEDSMRPQQITRHFVAVQATVPKIQASLVGHESESPQEGKQTAAAGHLRVVAHCNRRGYNAASLRFGGETLELDDMLLINVAGSGGLRRRAIGSPCN